ncbi:hypothetical protein WJX72_002005 [[Myrmecia] bisecta]|uniref:Uncharacterized protein n=1 Tax=[Myrmecia] bisecta TaxID=41462 RepID=A0AAW1PKW7_9CHLO
MLLAISSRSRRDSLDHSRLLRNEWRSPVKVQMCGAAAALTCRQHEEILFSHTLDICVCQEGLVAGPFVLVFWRLRLDWLWRRWWQAPQLRASSLRHDSCVQSASELVSKTNINKWKWLGWTGKVKTVLSKATVQLVHPDGSPARDPLVVDLFNRRLALDGGLLKLFKARVLKVHQGSPLAEDREGLSRQEFEPGATVLLEVLEAEETAATGSTPEEFANTVRTVVAPLLAPLATREQLQAQNNTVQALQEAIRRRKAGRSGDLTTPLLHAEAV